MMAEIAVPVTLTLFCEVNPLLLALGVAALGAYEATAIWDVRAAVDGGREVRPAEQHIHSFLESLPFMAVSALLCLHWDQARLAVRRHLDGQELSRNRVFRPGGEEYTAENGTFGLATICRQHVTCHRNQIVFEYTAKGARQREQAIADDQVCAVVRGLKRRRWGGDELLAYRACCCWHDVTSADLNDYLRELSGGGDFTVKDFRTWHATVLAAVGLAVSKPANVSPAAAPRPLRVPRCPPFRLDESVLLPSRPGSNAAMLG